MEANFNIAIRTDYFAAVVVSGDDFVSSDNKAFGRPGWRVIDGS